jgi:hypothetical protein
VFVVISFFWRVCPFTALCFNKKKALIIVTKLWPKWQSFRLDPSTLPALPSTYHTHPHITRPTLAKLRPKGNEFSTLDSSNDREDKIQERDKPSGIWTK